MQIERGMPKIKLKNKKKAAMKAAKEDEINLLKAAQGDTNDGNTCTHLKQHGARL